MLSLRSSIACVALFAVAACQSYGPEDLAAGTACGTREQICRNQCLKAYEAGGNADRYAECTSACEPTERTICR